MSQENISTIFSLCKQVSRRCATGLAPRSWAVSIVTCTGGACVSADDCILGGVALYAVGSPPYPTVYFFMCRWIASFVTRRWGVGFGVCLVNVTFYTQRLGGFMAYSDKAKAKRRCTATKKDGSRCLAYAIWDHPQQVCVAHSGRKRRRGLTHADRYDSLFEKIQTSKPLANGGIITTARYRKKRNRQIKCDCAAYPFPHRPGGGYCRWPDAPLVQTERVKSGWGVSLYGIEVCPQQRKRK